MMILQIPLLTKEQTMEVNFSVTTNIHMDLLKFVNILGLMHLVPHFILKRRRNPATKENQNI